MITYAPGAKIANFILERQVHLEEISSTVMLFRHRRLATRALAIKNDDRNKTFCIGFTTAPTDSTGVAHILEHSVLMGSRKYPVKDVFGEINKGGLMTFLNAMTGADTTWYPFATRNIKEYFSIMDVYCDVTLNPLLSRSTFEQEGWHYHKEGEQDPIRFQGVVFNEMKGAFSDPVRLLFHHLYKDLMPGSIYVHESGGDPREVPNLTYEQFCAFHAAHYHPDNATLFFYGDAPLEEELTYVDQHFLDACAPGAGAIVLDPGHEVMAPVLTRDHYAVQGNGGLAGKTFLAVGSTTGTVLEQKRGAAFQVIANILYNSDGSPLKKAILGAGVGKDFGGVFLSGSGYKTFMMTYLIGSDPDRVSQFQRLYREVLLEMVDQGIERDLLLSELNKYEFETREEASSAQRGLDLIGKALPALKHGADPFEALCIDEIYREIREEALHERYFEGLIREALLDNPATVTVILQPDPDKSARLLAEERARLDDHELRLDAGARAALIRRTQELIAEQHQGNDAATLALLPRLDIADLRRCLDFPTVSPESAGGRELLACEQDTGGICYLDLGLECGFLPLDLLVCLNLFGTIATEIGTSRLDYMRFAKEINTHAGDFDHSFMAYSLMDDGTRSRPILWLRLKALSSFLEPALDLVAELLRDLNLGDRDRIREIVLREFAWAEHAAQSEGYQLAMYRAFAGLSNGAAYNEAVSGYSSYAFLRDLAQNYEAMEDDFLERLERIRALLFRRTNLFFSLTAGQEDMQRFTGLAPLLVEALPDLAMPEGRPTFVSEQRHQAFVSPAEVVFNVLAGNLHGGGREHRGHLDVLKTWLSRDYLWNTVRQQGGAYGCFTQYNHITGNMGLISYRDPEVGKTFAAYEGIPRALERFRPEGRALEQLVIGTYGLFDPHQGSAARGAMARNEYVAGLTPAYKQARLDELLATTADDLRRYAPAFERLAATGRRSAIGNRAKLEAADGLFDDLMEI